MAYLSPEIARVMGKERADALEKLFARLDSIDAMLKNAEERTRRELAADPTLAERIRKMHRSRPARSARTLLVK